MRQSCWPRVSPTVSEIVERGPGSAEFSRLPQSTINAMGGLTQPSPVAEERDSGRKIIFIAVAVVMGLAILVAVLFRSPQKSAPGAPPAYAANVKISDLKMSAAENFIGATVSYIDGTMTNSGDKTVTRAVVEVVFKDDIGQLAQREPAVPLRALKTNGPYPEAVDLVQSPLMPGQSQPFRLTFESISAQWNHAYPEIRVTDVTAK